MRKADVTKPAAGISDQAVEAKTGKNWGAWFAILDAAGARKMDHKGIVAFLRERHGVGPWWQQMVTVAYEQARGRREKHQKPSGYEISRSKTFDVSVAKLFAAWQNPKARGRWLGEQSFAVRKTTPNKSLRITWVDGTTNVETLFYPKGRNRSQLTVQHSKLSDAQQAERMKAYWGEKLDRLKQLLEA